MKEEKYEYAVYIGRFQPFHIGHINTIKFALTQAKKLILILGSANSPRTIKTPFTVSERVAMLRSSLTDEEMQNVVVTSVEDQLYNNANWAASVLTEISKYTNSASAPDVVMVGAKKDFGTESYLNFFKKFKYLETPLIESSGGKNIDATKIRELFFSGHAQFIKAAITDGTYEFLCNFQKSPEFVELAREYEEAVNYDKKFLSFPTSYSLNFITVDAVVVQSGHVLLIKRKKSPGKDLWAVPGGHVNFNEDLESAVIRELKEETGIKIPEKVLKGSLKESKIFDHPDRSLRGRVFIKNGRTITNAYCFKLDDSADLPRVKGLDDASDAHWFTFSEVREMRDRLFEDHFDIILYFLNRL